ncbi:hypothetical protein DESC_500015 [Desulfosarcina cetonica]|nr:hypothetical protein DESC_500015 [Desulfosarcina cetonica]
MFTCRIAAMTFCFSREQPSMNVNGKMSDGGKADENVCVPNQEKTAGTVDPSLSAAGLRS